ncbi:hypothetical protein ACOSQ3_021600 [Xanthoceras sorbifolium]
MLSPVLAARNMGEASLLPPLPSSTHNFLEQCAAKLPVECGVEIVGTLLGDGILTAFCCSNLVAVGRPCHDEFLAVTLPYHKEIDPSIVLAKSEKNKTVSTLSLTTLYAYMAINNLYIQLRYILKLSLIFNI